ncbi:MAG: Flp pilus assembly protein CpaB [Proteobacteria bacterium]|nr:Flp pilus assembly protein CpaB [Pseudomonadota bacterium]MBK9253108.1 Flp pilus assembly protein CpaB [Pseudomonadota bacterium]
MRSLRLRSVLQSNLLLGGVALISGALAAWMGERQLEERAHGLERDMQQRYEPAAYVVASRDVSRGQTIDASLLAVRSMPKAYAPVDAVAPADAGLLMGSRAAIGIRRGTPVAPAALVPPLVGNRLSEQLPAGMRALTIQVDQLNALSGHLQAGDLVDLCYSRTRGSGAVLVPLLQRVRVLATGDLTETQLDLLSTGQRAGEFSSVTLLVSITDAQRLVLAEQTGRITLLLRRRADEGTIDARTFDSGDLLKTLHAGVSDQTRRSLSVELLVGGNGTAPVRSWLSAGEGA